MPLIGTKCTKSGIYMCSHCGFEQAFVEGDTFPACRKCQRPGINWVLVRPS